MLHSVDPGLDVDQDTSLPAGLTCTVATRKDVVVRKRQTQKLFRQREKVVMVEQSQRKLRILSFVIAYFGCRNALTQRSTSWQTHSNA